LATIKELLTKQPVSHEVVIRGWVRTRRDSKGGFSFVEVNDGSCFKSMQVVADKNLPNFKEEVLKLNAGCSIEVKGKLVPSAGKGQAVEVQASDIEVFGCADADYPLQKKRHSFEFLREIAHLRPRSNTFGAIARIRSGLAFAIHQFFQDQGFYYITTPIITDSDCEGAGELFQVTTFDLANIPVKDGTVDYEQDFFDTPVYLTVSGQLEGEVFASALGGIYTFGPTFRAENSNTPRHLAEFWMVEPEMAFCDLEQDIALATKFIKYLLQYVLDNYPDEMAFFDKFIEPETSNILVQVIEKDFQILEYTDAIDVLNKASSHFEYPPEWGRHLQAEHERYLCEQAFEGPVVVTNFPKIIKPFYMYVNDDDKTVRGMDVLVPRIGELIGGSQREHRLDVLSKRMDELQMNKDNYQWFIDLRRYGTVPHAGFGLGFERLILFVTGMKNIRDVIPFPRTPGCARF
jgi:asparaginyl-tRNA synthetase